MTARQPGLDRSGLNESKTNHFSRGGALAISFSNECKYPNKMQMFLPPKQSRLAFHLCLVFPPPRHVFLLNEAVSGDQYSLAKAFTTTAIP